MNRHYVNDWPFSILFWTGEIMVHRSINVVIYPLVFELGWWSLIKEHKGTYYLEFWEIDPSIPCFTIVYVYHRPSDLVRAMHYLLRKSRNKSGFCFQSFAGSLHWKYAQNKVRVIFVWLDAQFSLTSSTSTVLQFIEMHRLGSLPQICSK
jgi:hypothetical protein